MDVTTIGTVVPRRSSRQTHPPVKFRDYALMTSIMNVIEPLNYEQAKDKEEWVTAMNEEYNSIMRNKTWDVVELPKDKVPRGSKWLFKSELKADVLQLQHFSQNSKKNRDPPFAYLGLTFVLV